MLVYKTGNLLEATENLICHQVNTQGVMGGGLAKQIAEEYPEVEEEYINYCHDKTSEDLLGSNLLCSQNTGVNQFIANCFTQENMITRVDLIKKVFDNLLSYCKEEEFTIAIPYNYGCGIANGNWAEVLAVFEQLSQKHGVNIAVYRLSVR